MHDPLLVISFEAALAQRVRRIFRKSGENVEVLQGIVPVKAPNVRGVVVTAGPDTDIDSILMDLKAWDVPLFLVSEEQATSSADYFCTSSERLELDLLVEVQRHTGQETSTVTVWSSD